MRILYDDDNRAIEPVIDDLSRAASLCLENEGVDGDRCEISLSLVSLDEIHELNSMYRQVDRPTDVLSFPLYEDLESVKAEEGDIVLGDIVICMDKVIAQAEEFGHSRKRETVYLFIHSLLHLLGYDHMEEDEKRLMRSREEEVMEMMDLRRDRDDR